MCLLNYNLIKPFITIRSYHQVLPSGPLRLPMQTTCGSTCQYNQLYYQNDQITEQCKNDIYKYMYDYFSINVQNIIRYHYKYSAKQLSCDMYHSLYLEIKDPENNREKKEEIIKKLCSLMSEIEYFTDFNIPCVLFLVNDVTIKINKIFSQFMINHYNYNFFKLVNIMMIREEQLFVNYYSRVFAKPFVNNIFVIYKKFKKIVFGHNQNLIFTTIYNNFEDVHNDFKIIIQKLKTDINIDFDNTIKKFSIDYGYKWNDMLDFRKAEDDKIALCFQLLHLLYLFTKCTKIIKPILTNIMIYIKALSNEYSDYLVIQSIYDNLKTRKELIDIIITNTLINDYDNYRTSVSNLQDYKDLLVKLSSQ